MVLPDILKNAPFFKKIETKQARQRDAKSASKAKQAAQQRATGGARPKGAARSNGGGRGASRTVGANSAPRVPLPFLHSAHSHVPSLACACVSRSQGGATWVCPRSRSSAR